MEHVGSTAVPGLIAKPIIDLDVVLTSPCIRVALPFTAQWTLPQEGGRCSDGQGVRFAGASVDNCGAFSLQLKEESRKGYAWRWLCVRFLVVVVDRTDGVDSG